MASLAHSEGLAKSTAKMAAIHNQSAQSQEKINHLDNAAKAALDEYLANERIADVTVAYNRQISVLLDSQQAEIADLEKQIDSLTETDRAVLPMLNRMLEMLQEFVAKDTPFLLQERQQRLQRLRKLLSRADVSVAEKYRQITQAYAVEVQYGRTLEAYNGSLAEPNKQQVTFLRLGRVALYYQSLNGVNGGLWQPKSQSWQGLNEQQNQALTLAIQVAQQHKVPELLNLPLPSRDQ